ncbi:MAG: alanine racemase [Ignavibacteria bacterium]|nr:alanine racemase [Ignavibacteria bacterium]
MRLSRTQINLANIVHNYNTIREQVSPARVIPVVKADAYGHGMLQTVAALEQCAGEKPLLYAVAFCEEAVELKRSFPHARVLVFEPVHKDNVKEIVDYGLIASVSTPWHIECISNAVSGSEHVNVHVKIDSGMNRLGIQAEQAVGFIKSLSENKKIHLGGIYTHFSDSDNPDGEYTRFQRERLEKVFSELDSAGIDTGIKHAANSGGIWLFKDAYFDAVRAGISLYGYYPAYQLLQEQKIKPALELISVVESIKEIEQNSPISYSRTYYTKAATRIASVPIGYADGVPRALSNKMHVLINGKAYKQVGRVTMDRILIDIGNDDVQVGDTVTLIGNNGNMCIDAWDWSRLVDTIPYEITCLLNNNKRLPKAFIQ